MIDPNLPLWEVARTTITKYSSKYSLESLFKDSETMEDEDYCKFLKGFQWVHELRRKAVEQDKLMGLNNHHWDWKNLSEEQVTYMAIQSRGKCPGCKECLVNNPDTQVDHYHPKSINPEMMYFRENLWLLCGECNKDKGTKPHEQLHSNLQWKGGAPPVTLATHHVRNSGIHSQASDSNESTGNCADRDGSASNNTYSNDEREEQASDEKEDTKIETLQSAVEELEELFKTPVCSERAELAEQIFATVPCDYGIWPPILDLVYFYAEHGNLGSDNLRKPREKLIDYKKQILEDPCDMDTDLFPIQLKLLRIIGFKWVLRDNRYQSNLEAWRKGMKNKMVVKWRKEIAGMGRLGLLTEEDVDVYPELKEAKCLEELKGEAEKREVLTKYLQEWEEKGSTWDQYTEEDRGWLKTRHRSIYRKLMTHAKNMWNEYGEGITTEMAKEFFKLEWMDEGNPKVKIGKEDHLFKECFDDNDADDEPSRKGGKKRAAAAVEEEEESVGKKRPRHAEDSDALGDSKKSKPVSSDDGSDSEDKIIDLVDKEPAGRAEDNAKASRKDIFLDLIFKNIGNYSNEEKLSFWGYINKWKRQNADLSIGKAPEGDGGYWNRIQQRYDILIGDREPEKGYAALLPWRFILLKSMNFKFTRSKATRKRELSEMVEYIKITMKNHDHIDQQKAETYPEYKASDTIKGVRGRVQSTRPERTNAEDEAALMEAGIDLDHEDVATFKAGLKDIVEMRDKIMSALKEKKGKEKEKKEYKDWEAWHLPNWMSKLQYGIPPYLVHIKELKSTEKYKKYYMKLYQLWFNRRRNIASIMLELFKNNQGLRVAHHLRHYKLDTSLAGELKSHLEKEKEKKKTETKKQNRGKQDFGSNDRKIIDVYLEHEVVVLNITAIEFLQAFYQFETHHESGKIGELSQEVVDKLIKMYMDKEEHASIMGEANFDILRQLQQERRSKIGVNNGRSVVGSN